MTGREPPRSTTRDLERYAGLFARRTQVMKSSAMRDLMALTERGDVISLAGGMPDTSSFPPETYAALMQRIADEACARALQYGPTEGFAVAAHCIADVMAAEGMTVDEGELLVTTGGQQVIDLVCKTLVDPGDVIVAEAPTYPGALKEIEHEFHLRRATIAGGWAETTHRGARARGTSSAMPGCSRCGRGS